MGTAVSHSVTNGAMDTARRELVYIMVYNYSYCGPIVYYSLHAAARPSGSTYMQIKHLAWVVHWACRSNTPLSIRLHLTLVRIEAIKLRLPLNLPLISDLIWHGLGSRILAHSLNQI